MKHTGFSVCISLLWLWLATFSTAAFGQTNWTVTMSDVRVIGQCESGGDRPYFPALYFRSRINTPNSTVVDIVEYEPHDWVGKEPFKSGLPGGHDHMLGGNDLRLPFWMSPHQWRGVQSLPPITANSDSATMTAAMHSEILGVVVLGLDNRNTPPDVVRELLNDAAKIVQQLLVKEVESGRVVLPAMKGDFSVFEKNVSSEAQDIAGKIIDGWSVAGLLIRGGIGSFGSPDQFVGAKAFILPTIDGFPLTAIPAPSSAISIPAVSGSLARHSEIITFQGGCGNARYEVPFSITPEVCNGSEMISSVTISLLTGEDDLRSNSTVGLVVDIAGHPVTVPFLVNTGIDKRQELTRTVKLPSAVMRKDVRRIGLIFASRSDLGQTTDNWDLAAVRVDANGQILALQTGRPFMRFTGQNREMMLDTTCVPLNPASIVPRPTGRKPPKP